MLQHFSKHDRNRLRKFLLSPYFNEQEDVVLLFNMVDKAIRKGEAAIEGLEKEKVWKTVYPDVAYDDAQLRRVASELTNLILKFIGNEYISKRPLNEQVAIHQALTPTDLKKHLATVERRIQRVMAQKEQKALDDYYFDYKFSMARLGFATKNTVPKNYLDFLMPLNKQLDVFYIAQKLQFFCRLVIFKQTRQADAGFDNFDEIIRLSDSPSIRTVPLVESYRTALLALLDISNTSNYFHFLDILHKHEHAITKEDLQDLYQNALNFCAFRINSGDRSFVQEMFGIYKVLAKNELLVLHGFLPEPQYKNIIGISLNCGDFEWTEDFITKYAEYLPENLRENASSYNLAYLNFIKKNYGKVVELLRNVEYSNLSYALGARWLLVRTYFDTDEYQALDSLLESFRIYVMRNKLMSKKLKKTYINMISLTKRLTTLPTPDKLAKIKDKVIALDKELPTGWLMAKISEMEKRR